MVSDKLYNGGFYNDCEKGWLGGIFCLACDNFVMEAFTVNTKEVMDVYILPVIIQ